MNVSPIILSAFALLAIPQDPYDDGWSVRSPMRKRVDEILDGRSKAEPEHALLAKLVALGPDAIPEVLDLLLGSGEPALGADFAELLEQGGGPDELLLLALDRWPSETVVSAVRDYTLDQLAELEFDDQVQSMAILGRVGRADALDPMFEIIARADPVHLLRPTIQLKIEGPLIQIFERDAKCLRVLVDRFDEIQVELWPSLARAIGANMRSPGIDLLQKMLGRDAKLDRLVLEQLSRLDPRDWKNHASQVADILRRYLSSADRRLRKQAVTSLGRLRYVAAFEEIVAMLDDSDRSVQQGAAFALQAATGLSWRVASQEWDTWFASQLSWLARVRIEVAGEVLDEDPARAIRAIRELSERPIFRNQLSEIIADGTAHPEDGVVLFACTALSSLGSPYSLQALLPLLLHDSETVQAAAHKSLEQISGQELPPEYSTWQDWLNG